MVVVDLVKAAPPPVHCVVAINSLRAKKFEFFTYFITSFDPFPFMFVIRHGTMIMFYNQTNIMLQVV
ncbi:hypothetical protein LINGRAHAP2_LOCUS33482 [Linum grandiflorum]